MICSGETFAFCLIKKYAKSIVFKIDLNLVVGQSVVISSRALFLGDDPPYPLTDNQFPTNAPASASAISTAISSSL